ncbi:MAG: hypothetical protein KDN05_18120, partial [Verrucomicrobiae bacterium]|nr:hypothetical protein [Verrucomicrobiae bacterium]
LPKTVAVTTNPPGLLVNVSYNGSPDAPLAPGSYAVSAVVDDPDYAGSASGTLVIGNRGFTLDLTNWIATTSTMSAANTSSPLWNPDHLSAGIAGSAHAFFEPIQLAHVGDRIQLAGTVAVQVLNNSKPVNNRGLWFRFGLFRNQSPVTSPTDPITDWLGYCAMANSTPALYERTSTGHYASSITGPTARTPQVSSNGANSSQNSITLQFTETITRTATGVDVSFDATNTATSAKVISFTYSDTTPNNNGVLSGPQSSPTDPAHVPVFSAAGFVFSGEYIGSSTANAQFSNVQISYSSPEPGASQTIDFPPLADRTYGDPPLSLTATASSGLPVSYEIVSGQADLSGNTLTPTGVGEITVRASQSGSIDFLSATPVEQTFTVNKAEAVVSLSDLAHTYDGDAKSATVTTDPGGLVVDLLYDGNQAAPVDPGSYEVTAVVVSDYHEGSASGTLVISPAHSAIEEWRNEHFQTYDNTGDAADGADPNHDGEPNLLEFATGQDPWAFTSASIDLAIVGESLEYTYDRSKTAFDAGYQFVVESSDTLEDPWTSFGAGEVLGTNGDLQSARVIVPMGSGDRRFLRLHVMAP